MILTISGIILMLFGLVVSIVFWIPGIINKEKIKNVMGTRYPLIYVVYIANGPMLVLFGLLLVIWSKAQWQFTYFAGWKYELQCLLNIIVHIPLE